MNRVLLIIVISVCLTQSGKTEEPLWLIPAVFEEALPFSGNGLAAVKDKGKWGYIDSNGKGKIKNLWDLACSFSGPIALVKRANTWGIINQDGEVVVEPRFLAASHFTDGLSFVIDDSHFGVIDAEGEWKFKVNHSLAEIDPSKDFTTNDRIIRYESQGGIMVARDQDFSLVMTEKGELIQKDLPLRVDFVSQPTEWGIAMTIDKRCVIANAGGILFDSEDAQIQKKYPDAKFSSAGFSEGVAPILLRMENRFSLIAYLSSDGKMLVDFREDNGAASWCFQGGLGVYSKSGNGPRGFVSKTGEVVIEPRWENVTNFTKAGYAMTENKGVVQIIDKTGAVVAEVEGLDAPGRFGYRPSEQEGYFLIQKGLYNHHGKKVFVGHNWPRQIGASSYFVAQGKIEQNSNGEWAANLSIFDGEQTKLDGSYASIVNAHLTTSQSFSFALAQSLETSLPYPQKGEAGFGYIKLPKMEK